MILTPKNWDKFQHYKDRNPPWIKLHRDLLNNKEFMRLPLASKALAPLLWLLASESVDGSFDADIDELEFRLRLSKDDISKGLKPLIDNGFFLDASTMLAPRLQVATPETEGETEKREKAIATPTGLALLKDINQDVAKQYIKVRGKKTLTALALAKLQAEADKAKMTLEEALIMCCQNSWVGFNADWEAVKNRENKSEKIEWK